jgi:FkbM family methyltransferase
MLANKIGPGAVETLSLWFGENMIDCDILGILPIRPTIKVVDIGAMFDAEDPTPFAKLVQAGIAEIIGFDPVQEECDKLNATAGHGCRYLPFAIGDGRKRTFHICNSPMTSSLYEPNTPLVERFQNLENLMRIVKTMEIQTHRLDEIKEVDDADFLKLDVQGAELDVLTGAPRVLVEAVLVQTEVEFVPMYKDQPLFAEVDQHLRRQGYLFHKFAGTAGRTFKPLVVENDINKTLSQTLWADAVYVKNFMELDRLSPEKLLKLAVILHLQYTSFDLALESLKAYDAKTGAGLANKYVQGLVKRK